LGGALAAPVRRHAGEVALIQRCQVHKRRNVIDHLPEEHKSAVRKKLQNADAMSEYAEAKRALDRLHRELMELNPSAARSRSSPLRSSRRPFNPTPFPVACRSTVFQRASGRRLRVNTCAFTR
jgi:putative transposase